MIINRNVNSVFEAEPLTKTERLYLAECGFVFQPGTRILKNPNLQIWEPDSEGSFRGISGIDLDSLETAIIWFLGHEPEENEEEDSES